eukprot:gene13483-18091_t
MLKRFSLISSDTIPDIDIDEGLTGLYPLSSILEQRCKDSLVGDSDNSIGNINTSKHFTAIDNSASTPDLTITPELIIEGLSSDYFTANYDPLEDDLSEISAWGSNDMVEKFMTKIEKADSDKDVIIIQLAAMIDANYNDLMSCLRNVHDIDLDLGRAGNQIKGARRKIKSACGVLNSGAIKIKSYNAKRDKLQGIVETTRSLKALKDIHRAMTHNITTGEVAKAAEYAKSVMECLVDDSFNKFVSLKTISESTQRSICNIRQKSDKALKRIASRKFSSVEYEKIVKSYLILDHMAERMKISLYDASDFSENSSSYFGSIGCIDGLSQRINRFQLDDIDDCLHSSVMEYIYASQHKKQKAAAELSVAGAYISMNEGEIRDLVDAPLHMLYRRLTPDVIAPCVVRSCALLAEMIHTHYLLTQWHSSPFDVRNNDWNYLHRKAVDIYDFTDNPDDSDDNNDEEDEDENEDDTPMAANRDSNSNINSDSRKPIKLDKIFKKMTYQQSLLSEKANNSVLSALENNFSTATNSHSSDYENNGNTTIINDNKELLHSHSDDDTSQLIRLYSVKLAIVYQNLIQSRAVLWEEVSHALVEMLEMITVSATLKPDDFLSIVSGINSMIVLGKEFCNSDCKALKNSLQEKSKEYFQYFHFESFQIIRIMVETENWFSVPINLEQNGGIIGLIKSNLFRDLNNNNNNNNNNNDNQIKSPNQRRKSTIMGVPMIKERSSSISSGMSTNDSTISADPSNHHNSANNAIKSNNLTVDTQTPESRDALSRSHSMLMMFGTTSYPFQTQNNHQNNEDSINNTNHDDNNNTNNNEKDFDSPIKRQGILQMNLFGNDEFWDGFISDDEDNASNNFTPTHTTRKPHDNTTSMVVTQAALNGLARYAAKYLHLMYLLPSAAPEIFTSLCHLFDYYLCSVFNGFISSEEKVKFLAKPTKMTAPAPHQSREFESLKEYFERCVSEVVYIGISRTNHSIGTDRNDTSRDSDSVNNNPLDFDNNNLNNNSNNNNNLNSNGKGVTNSSPLEAVKLGSLLRNPSIDSDAHNCYALKERVVASESCWFIAMILQDMKSKLIKLLPERYRSICDGYITMFQEVAGQLRALIYKTLCPQVIKQTQILNYIVESCAWDSKKLRESDHEWVGRLIDNCKEAWIYMNNTEEFADASSIVREQVWLEICQAAFDTVIDGYSRIKKCSTEGRAAMTMDIFSLHDGLNNIHICRPPRGKHYIDSFLRTCYLNDDDIMQWINENYHSYAYRHVYGLLVQTMTSVLNNKKFKDAVSVIDNLYEQDTENNNNNSKFSNLLSGRLKEDNKLSTIISQRLKRK